MKLFIAEKPSLGRTVANVLGNGRSFKGGIDGGDWVVTWCFGHLFEPKMPEHYNKDWKKWELQALPMVPPLWQLNPRKDAKDQIDVIKKLLTKAEVVINVGDPDREGQLLVDEVLEEANWTGSTQRLWLTDLTTKGIRKALSSIVDNAKYQGLCDAARARQRADWLVGMNLTRAYTLRAQQSGHQGVLSVGRVQTPTLALVVDRDNAIDRFVSKQYFEVSGEFDHDNGSYVGKLVLDEDITDEEGRMLDQRIAQQLCREIEQEQSGVISKLTKKKKTQHPPLCYSLTDLQAMGSKRLNLSANQVLQVAQSLYETHKMITYPRSESGYLAENQLSEAPDIVQSLSASKSLASTVTGTDLSLRSKVWNDKKSSAAAHTAIIPTGDMSQLSKLNDQELKLFTLIATRYLIQFYPPNVIEQTTFMTELGKHVFRTTGNVTLVEGWKSVVKSEANDEKGPASLIEVANGDGATLSQTKLSVKNTTPPKRFAEGTLVVAMKNIAQYIQETDAKAILKDVEGIGTVATRSNIIEGLKKRDFLVTKAKSLISTTQGKVFINLLPDPIKSAVTTARWEAKLSQIEAGKLSLEQFTKDQVDYVRSSVNAVTDIKIQTDKNAIACPKCKEGVLSRRKGQYGIFWGCSRYKEGCKQTFKDKRGKPELKPKKTTATAMSEDCPNQICDGTVNRFKRKKGNGYLWVCKACDEAGRNKFYNDANGYPVAQR